MSSELEYGPDFVNRAAADLLMARPAYRDLIGFYAEIFAAQEKAKPQICIDAFHLPPDLVRIKLKEQFPLVQPPELRFDPTSCQMLFGNICRIAADRRTELAESGSILLEHSAEVTPFFRSLLDGDEERMKEAADAFGVRADALGFFLYHSLRPSLCRCEQDLSGFLPEGLVWEKGYCPICGSPPVLAWLEADGRQSLFCSFCWHRWPGRRAACPFCGNGDPNQLSYLYTEEEREYRVEVCDACRKYLKTVDGRQLPRVAYPPLEQIASLHLDLKAAEAGYEPCLPLALKT